MQVDASKWSGEGEFTHLLIECLKGIAQIEVIRVEDAPATRSEADYNFISNEVFVAFGLARHDEPVRRFGFLPGVRSLTHKTMTVAELEKALTALPEIGAPDYSDEVMLQYLKTERIVPPYQTRGYKLVELVRLYEVGAIRLR